MCEGDRRILFEVSAEAKLLKQSIRQISVVPIVAKVMAQVFNAALRALRLALFVSQVFDNNHFIQKQKAL